MTHISDYLMNVERIAQQVNTHDIEKIIVRLITLRKRKGRLFLLGVGGSAGNCSHAVSDFRKIAGIETYTPVDNVSELTARTNDEGWHTVFVEWLKDSHLSKNDAVLVLSVGGGNKEKNISVNLVHALEYARKQHATILGIVGRDGGTTAQLANVCVIIPVVNPATVTALTEAFQGVILHLIVSDPRMMVVKNKWESTVSSNRKKKL